MTGTHGQVGSDEAGSTWLRRTRRPRRRRGFVRSGRLVGGPRVCGRGPGPVGESSWRSARSARNASSVRRSPAAVSAPGVHQSSNHSVTSASGAMSHRSRISAVPHRYRWERPWRAGLHCCPATSSVRPLEEVSGNTFGSVGALGVVEGGRCATHGWLSLAGASSVLLGDAAGLGGDQRAVEAVDGLDECLRLRPHSGQPGAAPAGEGRPRRRKRLPASGGRGSRRRCARRCGRSRRRAAHAASPGSAPTSGLPRPAGRESCCETRARLAEPAVELSASRPRLAPTTIATFARSYPVTASNSRLLMVERDRCPRRRQGPRTRSSTRGEIDPGRAGLPVRLRSARVAVDSGVIACAKRFRSSRKRVQGGHPRSVVASRLGRRPRLHVKRSK